MASLDELLPDEKKERDELLLAASLVLFDALVRHQIFLQRHSGSLRNTAVLTLNDTEKRIADIVKSRFPTGVTPESLRRVDDIVAEVRAMRIVAWGELKSELRRRLRDVTDAELSFLRRLFAASLPDGVDLTLPTGTHFEALRTPFDGKTLTEWLNDLQRDDIARITQSLRVSLALGESPTAAAKRIVGVARNKGRDGTTQTTRRRVDSFTRMAVTHFGSQAQLAFMQENFPDAKELYVAILDSRTTPICRSLSGDVYEVGEGPHPPLHYGCRSRRIPFLGDTPPDLPSYQDWLARQPAEFQDDVLGKTKGKLFRQGGLDLNRFVNRNGDELTLSELAEREAAAFRAAGLDPGDYR